MLLVQGLVLSEAASCTSDQVNSDVFRIQLTLAWPYKKRANANEALVALERWLVT